MMNMDSNKDIVESLSQWRGRLKAYFLSKSLMGTPSATELLEDLDDIIKGMDIPADGGLTLNKVHPIDRLGLALVVLPMYCDGTDTATISKVIQTQTGMEVTPSEVQQWVDKYEASGVVGRNTLANHSIFDTKNRMEDIYLMLQRLQSDIEMADPSEFARAKTTRYEVQLAAAGQLRSAVKDARQVVEALHQMNTYHELARIIVEEIRTESPAVAQRILQVLKKKGVVVKAVLPSS